MANEYEDYKFVVALNKTIPEGKAINAAAHAVAGLTAKVVSDAPSLTPAMQFLDFTDAAGEVFPFVSARSLIVLRGRGGELRKLRESLASTNAVTVAFIEGMTGDTYVEQLQRVSETDPESHIYYAVAAFGTRSDIDQFTRKLSLWQ
jgi:hypothetical protein